MKKYFLLYMAVFAGLGLSAQNVMTPDLLWKLGRVSLDDISPDGKYVLYGITTYDMEKNKGTRYVYRIPVNGGVAERVGTREGGSESGAHFVGNSKTIAFSRDGQLHLREWGGREVPVTDVKDGINNPRLYQTKDGHRLVFSKKIPRREWPMRTYESLRKANVRIYDDLMYRHWDTWQDEMTEHLCYADLPKKIVHPVVAYKDLMKDAEYAFPVPPFGGSSDFTLHPDGKYLAYVLKPVTGVAFATGTNTQIMLFDFESGETKVLSADNPGYDKYPQFSPDGKYLSWLSMPRAGFEADQSNFVIYDIEDGKAHRMDGDYWHSYAWADKNTVYITKDEKATIPVYEMNFKFSRGTISTTVVPFSTGQYNFGTVKAVGKTVVAERQDMNYATEIFSIDKKGNAEAITAVNSPVYARLEKSEIREKWVTTTDGKKMLVWVILPPDFDENKKYPALLYCQGGPQSAVSQFYSFRWNFQVMAAQGYVVIAPNRRGLPGFGKDWNDDISKDWGGQAISDYLSAFDEVTKESYIDEKRVGAVGASYGGYSVYQLAGVHNKRFKSFISHCGLFHMESWYGTTEELFFADWDLGGPYWETRPPNCFGGFSPDGMVD
jgi:dipeptidyl aminopeptidase/acylaminoacyl peptidase